MATFVQLKRGWPGGTFHRTLKDAKRKEFDRLEFTAGEPIEVSAKQLAALKSDIGPALEIVKAPPVVYERDVPGPGVPRLLGNDPEEAFRSLDADRAAIRVAGADIEQKHPKGGPASL